MNISLERLSTLFSLVPELELSRIVVQVNRLGPQPAPHSKAIHSVELLHYRRIIRESGFVELKLNLRNVGRLCEFLKTLPQPGLWGRSPRGSVPIDSDVARRMNQLRAEMRRHSRVGLSLGERSVLIEGDRVEIS